MYILHTRQVRYIQFILIQQVQVQVHFIMFNVYILYRFSTCMCIQYDYTFHQVQCTYFIVIQYVQIERKYFTNVNIHILV